MPRELKFKNKTTKSNTATIQNHEIEGYAKELPC
jgi:hypothetical protein